MPEITLEKTHALLEKLAEYVMTQMATHQELDEWRQEMNAMRFEMIEKIKAKANNADVHRIDRNVKLILEGMDAQAKRLETLTIDNISTSRTLKIHEDRLGDVEEHIFGTRVREDKEKYKNKSLGENKGE